MSADATVDSESVISAFNALPTNEARRQAYRSLLSELRPAEWRDLQQRANARTFQHDILGSLPLEIAAHICSYLDPVDIISSRRVSKRWKELMSLSVTCGTAFTSLFPGENISTLSNPQWENRFTQAAKRRHAIMTGRPYSKTTYASVNGSLKGLDYLTAVDYYDGKFAWVCDRGVRTFCIKSGKSTFLTTENREHISAVQISQCLVAGISTRGVCHVWSLHDDRTYSFRLPSLNINQFVVSRRKVIMIIYVQPGTLLVWDAETQITMDTLVPEHPDAIYFNPARNCISFIHMEDASGGERDAPRFKAVAFSEYSITGSRIYRSTPFRPILCDHRFDAFWFSSRHASDPHVIMYQWVDSSVTPAPPSAARLLLFDFNTESSRPSVSTSWGSLERASVYSKTVINIPGGVAYQAYDMPTHPRYDQNVAFAVYNPESGSRKCSEIGHIESELEGSAGVARSHPTNRRPVPRIYADEQFLCLEKDEEVTVYCFDEELSLPGEDLRYREIRKQRAEERAQLRRESVET